MAGWAGRLCRDGHEKKNTGDARYRECLGQGETIEIHENSPVLMIAVRRMRIGLQEAEQRTTPYRCGIT
jgi:hypothetical protein